MTTSKNSRIARASFDLYKIPVKMNVEELLFSDIAGLHLQGLLRNKLI